MGTYITGDKETWVELGKFILSRRMALGLSMRQVSARSGVAVQTWGWYENGQAERMRHVTATKIENALDLEQGYIEARVTGAAPVVENDLLQRIEALEKQVAQLTLKVMVD